MGNGIAKSFRCRINRRRAGGALSYRLSTPTPAPAVRPHRPSFAKPPRKGKFHEKSIEGLLWLTGGAAALLAATAIFIVLTFDPNQYKADIVSAVRDATGRELTIHGDLGLSLFPGWAWSSAPWN